MKTQAYYRIRYAESNIADNSIDFLVNCSGFANQKVRTKSTRHDYYLMYLIDGEMSFLISEKAWKMEAGEFIIIPPETEYFYKTHEDNTVSYLWLHFTGREIENFLAKCKLLTNTVYRAGEHKALKDLWQSIFNEFILSDTFFAEVSVSLLKEILIFLSRYVHTNSILQPLSKSIVYIHENYMSNIQIGFLAKLENMCLTSYRKKFQEHLDCTAKEYLISVRLNHASQLLIESNLKLKEVAALVGYDDVYYFSRIFKEKIGMSPQKFRQCYQ